MSFGLNEHRSPYYVGFGYASNGGPEEIRTLGLSDANRTLYQLSYGPKYFYSITGFTVKVKRFLGGQPDFFERKARLYRKHCKPRACLQGRAHTVFDKPGRPSHSHPVPTALPTTAAERRRAAAQTNGGGNRTSAISAAVIKPTAAGSVFPALCSAYLEMLSFRMTSWLPPSTMLVEETTVSLAFCCSSGMESAPQLHMVERTLYSVLETPSFSEPAYGT